MKRTISIIALIGFLIALTMAMFTSCCPCKNIVKETPFEHDKKRYIEELRKGELTQCEYNDLLISAYELQEMQKSLKHKNK